MIDKALKNKKDCMGCHACANICPKQCISMVADVEGFLYPTVDYSLCIKCSKCINVCPIINKLEIYNNPIAYCCINKDEAVRLDSSSGGVFTLVAENIINKGGVVFGASFNDEFEVEHVFADKKEKLWELRGSKYVQSKIGLSYKRVKEFLDLNRKVLFTGTPCQVSGLKSYLGKNYSNLVTIDFICHGVPSPDIWKKYIKFREKEAGATTSRIAFRRKDEGWKQYLISFWFKNNTVYHQNRHKDLYMRAFLKDVCLRPSCYDCKFKGTNRHSDLTLGDFWGINNILPEMDDDKGTSLIMINSESGRALFDEIKDEMVYQEVDIKEAIKFNSAAMQSPLYNPKRDGFMADKDTMDFDRLVKKYCTDPFFIRVKRKVKSWIKRVLIKVKIFEIVRLFFNG